MKAKEKDSLAVLKVGNNKPDIVNTKLRKGISEASNRDEEKLIDSNSEFELWKKRKQKKKIKIDRLRKRLTDHIRSCDSFKKKVRDRGNFRALRKGVAKLEASWKGLLDCLYDL
jgi:hypothetical protein